MEQPRKPLNFILVKPAGPDCNMGCRYCFYLEKAELFSQSRSHRMSEDILQEMIRQSMEQSDENISFGWQGGEPTLMGLPFFEKAVYYQQLYGNGKLVGNGLQTNGLQLDYSWGKFLKQYHFLVGLSIDGPQHVHDHYRLLKSGKGSWEKVVDKAKLMLDMGVDINALTVVNDYSVQYPEEIYAFHKSIGFSFMQFIPCVETHPSKPGETAPFSLDPGAYGGFLIKIFDLWRADFVRGVPTTFIRYFDSVLFHYVGLQPSECTLLPSCGVYVVVEHNGNVYACDFFVEPNWELGNVKEGRLVDMLNSVRQYNFACLKANLPIECKSCKWLHYCWGGCIKDRHSANNLNRFCQSFKMFYKYADPHLKQIADQWKRQQKQQLTSRGKPEIPMIKELTDHTKIGRNNPCPCGSGKKYKKCCGRKVKM
jgi:uncharacterized protein